MRKKAFNPFRKRLSRDRKERKEGAFPPLLTTRTSAREVFLLTLKCDGAIFIWSSAAVLVVVPIALKPSEEGALMMITLFTIVHYRYHPTPDRKAN